MITWILFPPLYFFNGIFMNGLYKWGIMLSLLGMVIPPFCFSFGIPRIGISIGAILSAAELPVATLCSALILNEPVDPIRWTGVILILLAIVATNLRIPQLKKSPKIQN